MPSASRAKLAPIPYASPSSVEGGNAAASMWIPIGLAFVTFGVFAWACGAEFVTWDDGIHVFDNAGLKSPTLHSLWAFWAHPYQNLYIPLTYSMWWVLALFSRVPGGAGANGAGAELNPWVFHSASVLLQCLSVVLVWRLLRNLLGTGGGGDWPAAAGALLWAIHPLQVESVAWVSAGKDQLCGVLALAAVLAFIKRQSQHPIRDDLLATLLYVAALLAKPTAVVMPLIAAVLVLFFTHRPRRWRWLALWVLLALGDVLITRIAQPVAAPADGGRWWWRPLIACNALEFYLVKLIVPVRLAIQYNREPGAVIAAGVKNLRWIVPIVCIAGAWLARRRFPYLLAGLLIFIAGLLPMLGLVPFRFQDKSAVADHYAHLALLGPALAVAWGLCAAAKRWRFAAAVAAGVALMVLGGLSVAQTQTWNDSITLYQYTLQVNPQSWIAAQNLGDVYEGANFDRKAIPYFLTALQYEKPNADLYVDYANALAKTGQFDKAEAEYQKAAAIDPKNASLIHNWAYMRELWKQWKAKHPPATAPARP